MQPLRNPLSGFSLIEAMVSLIVLSVGMIGIAALYGQGLGAGRNALYRTVAVNLAADLADRIRANRLGQAGYNGPAVDNNCGPGGGVDCTPAQMASHDLFLWDQQITAQLPTGQWFVQFAAGATPDDAPTYTIRVSWQEAGFGLMTHETRIQVPNI
jgi:type IV pilus assembly protein PilV